MWGRWCCGSRCGAGGAVGQWVPMWGRGCDVGQAVLWGSGCNVGQGLRCGAGADPPSSPPALQGVLARAPHRPWGWELKVRRAPPGTPRRCCFQAPPPRRCCPSCPPTPSPAATPWGGAPSCCWPGLWGTQVGGGGNWGAGVAVGVAMEVGFGVSVGRGLGSLWGLCGSGFGVPIG